MNKLKIDQVLHLNIINVLNFFGIAHKSFFVGGMVRDHLLGLPCNDIDIVVSNISHSEVVDLTEHLHLTGKDFPVFRFRVLDSNQVEWEIELSVARIERSTGPGHKDFAVEFGENVSLEDDLVRRDITVNSMAVPVTDIENLVDLFNGVSDLEHKIIRHTSHAFSEDPLRIFRVARFLARFSEFVVHEDTIELCKVLCNSTLHLSGDRVGGEVVDMFKSCRQPSVFFKFLKHTNNLHIWFPELHNMIGVPQPVLHHGTNDVFDHTMETIDNARIFTNDVNILFGALFHDVGKIFTPAHILPAHHGHEDVDSKFIDNIVDRLRLSGETKKHINDAIRNHMKLSLSLEMRDKKVINMVSGLVRNDTFHNVIAVSHADRMRKGGLSCETIKRLHKAEFAVREKLPQHMVEKLKGKTGDQCKELVHVFRLNKFKEIS